MFKIKEVLKIARKFYRARKSPRRFYRVNYNIKAPKVRLIGPDKKQIGIVSLEKAREEAKKYELDLIEVAPNADPPVCKILDFSKFKYELSRKKRLARKKSKEVEVKELRFGPNISSHDLNVRFERAKDFLEEGNKVKFAILFKGREITHPEIGRKNIDWLLDKLKNEIEIEIEPKLKGKILSTVVIPAKKGKPKETDAKEKKKS